MRLVDDIASSEDNKVDSTGPHDVFWRDVASTNGVRRKHNWEETVSLVAEYFIEVPSVEVIKASWFEDHQSLVKVISDIQTFHEDAHTPTHTHTKNLQRLLTNSKSVFNKKESIDVILCRLLE